MSFKLLLPYIDTIVLDGKGEENELSVPVSISIVTAHGKSCKYCPGIFFMDADSFREHYKSGWHNHNQVNFLRNKAPLTLEEFEELSTVFSHESDSSDFWSEEEEDEADYEDDFTTEPISPLIQFRCADKTYEIYRSLLSRDKHFHFDLQTIKSFISTASNSTWTLFLIKSGRVFAGVFDLRTERWSHKRTFKRYTERRKQGGSQMLRDKSGKIAKSAGSQIRRQNEMELLKDVKDLMTDWQSAIRISQYIFWNKNFFSQLALFQCPLVLERSDSKLLTFPFTTYKPCEEEALRCIKQFCPRLKK